MKSSKAIAKRTLRNTSWVDLLVTWIEGLPLSSWLIYPSLVILFTVADRLIFIYEPGTSYVDAIYSASATVWTLVINHVLHNIALSSFDQFRPRLAVSKQLADEYREKFAYASPWIGWINLLIGLSTFATFWNVGVQDGLLEGVRSPAFAFIFGLLLFAGNSSLVIYFVMNSIRRLRLIIEFHKQIKQIDLFDLGPLRAFSRFSSTTAGALLLSIALFQRFGSDTEDITFYLVLGLVAVVVFVVPLLGLRNRISEEKDKLIKSITSDLVLVADEMRSAVRQGELNKLDKLKNGQDGLNFQREEVRNVRAWPWRPATVRGFSSAFLLPIFIWLITRLLERFI